MSDRHEKRSLLPMRSGRRRLTFSPTGCRASCRTSRPGSVGENPAIAYEAAFQGDRADALLFACLELVDQFDAVALDGRDLNHAESARFGVRPNGIGPADGVAGRIKRGSCLRHCIKVVLGKTGPAELSQDGIGMGRVRRHECQNQQAGE